MALNNSKPSLMTRQVLRAAAEAEFERTHPLAKQSPQTRPADRRVHELEVHQIELEMQNETLLQAQAALEETRDRYVDLYEFAPVGYLTLSREGLINAINLTGASLLGEARSLLLDRHFASFVVAADIDRWQEHFLGAFRAGGETSIELNLMRKDGRPFTAGIECLWTGTIDQQATVRVTLSDISERRLATLELGVAHEKLENFSAMQALHLREVAVELTHAEQHERDRLHGLLHDDMQPLLVAVRLLLSGLSPHTPPSEMQRVASDAIEHISQVLKVARTLSFELSPPLIREQGLNAALQAYCHWIKSTYGLEVDLTPAPDAEPDDAALRLVCFRAVCELLINVVKYAGVKRAALSLQRVDEFALCILLADRGCGFDTSRMEPGTGMAAIRRRLEMFGGALQIDSAPGRGTVVTLWVPLRGPRSLNAGRRAHDAYYE